MQEFWLAGAGAGAGHALVELMGFCLSAATVLLSKVLKICPVEGLDTVSQGFLVGGVSSRPISEVDRTAALGPVGASIKLEPHPPSVAVPDLDPALSFVPSISERAIKPCCVPLSDVDAPPVVAAAALKLPHGFFFFCQRTLGKTHHPIVPCTPEEREKALRKKSDPAERISPISCEPLDVNRPVCSDVDYAETMPPSESGRDSIPALSTVYPDYGAVDSTAVTRAFSAAFHLGSPDQRNEDELFARQAINEWQRMARWVASLTIAETAFLVLGQGPFLLVGEAGLHRIMARILSSSAGAGIWTCLGGAAGILSSGCCGWIRWDTAAGMD
ncbi:hypothetical protein Nepgr_017417 [Nepenthes gracilis]|uniref:Uncharacterized protein n=1 Tax=Nepenthes gracilis TaxID=150966 RepID=A0AAD3SSL7_NEPGR|nr:hypothetical protein Nepgr_017417 [Nepenthes gracilis]